MEQPADVLTASIVVNNYNYERFIGRAIDSALRQTYPHVDVIVVDDGSTDRSREVIAGYGSTVTPVLKGNGGQASAFSAGFAASRGEVVLFLDADDELLPTAVETVVPLFRDPRVVKVHWPLWFIDEEGRRTGGMLPDGELAEGNLRDAVLRLGPDSYLSTPTSGNAWSRAALDEVLPCPDPEAYRQGADGYLLTLTPLLGMIRRVTEPLSLYRVHGGNQFWGAPTDERASRSLLRYERRADTLAQYLRQIGIEADPQSWKRSNPYYAWLQEIRQSAGELRALIPTGEIFVLVDEGQWGLDPLAGRRALPFLERDGQYWGPPADSAMGIRELDRMIDAGARYVVFARPAFWWLDHFAELRQHLDAIARRVLDHERLVVFACGEAPPARPEAGAAAETSCPSVSSSATTIMPGTSRTR